MVRSSCTLFGKLPAPHVVDVLAGCADHLVPEVGVLLDERRHEFLEQTQRVITYQHLAVAVRPRADPDGRNRQRFRDGAGDVGWNRFQYDGK